ncbi:MAG: LysR family transcriptional regulator [Eubacterium sp.]|nr:LysR family transcriptional regulator [Eubacterium sp.]
MELSHLKYFQLTAELQHITKAAEQLYISQPALSKTISKLENELGVKLFDREGKNVYLNDYGHCVLDHANRIFSELDEMEREISDMKNGTSGSLSVVSVYASSDPTWLISSLSHFIEKYPNVNIDFFKTEIDRLGELLLNREIDIAFSSTPIESQYIDWAPLFSEKIGIVLSERHPFANKKGLHMIDFKDERFCIMDVNSDSYNLTMDLCSSAHFTPNIGYLLDNSSLLGQVLTKGNCVSIITENGFYQSQARDKELNIPDDKVFIPLKDEFAKRTCYMGFLNNRYKTRSQMDFIDYIISITKDI